MLLLSFSTRVLVIAPQVVAAIAVVVAVLTLPLAIVIVASAAALVIVITPQPPTAIAVVVAVFALALAVVIVASGAAPVIVVASQVVAAIVAVSTALALELAVVFTADLRHSGASATSRQQATSHEGGHQFGRIASRCPVEQSRPPVKLSSVHGRSSTAYVARRQLPAAANAYAPPTCAFPCKSLVNRKTIRCDALPTLRLKCHLWCYQQPKRAKSGRNGVVRTA
jgi:hypothetical protein